VIRVLAGLAGLALVCSAAHVTIMSGGGYSQTAAIVTMALAIGVTVGAAALGAAAGHGRLALAIAIGLGLAAGEAYALLSTSERVIVAREAAQVPLRDALKRHQDAERRVSEARTALDKVGEVQTTSTREVAAKASLEAANRAIVEKAALPGCRENCRQLLQTQADEARRELETAQRDVANQGKERRQKAERELATAEQALETSPLPGSATPLADRLGIQPWLLDIIAAGLLSLGVNGLGAALIALAAHGKAKPEPIVIERTTAPIVLTPEPAKPKAIAPANVVALPNPTHGRVSRFVAEQLEPASRGKIEVVDLYKAYASWCERVALQAFDVNEFGDQLQQALEIAGITTKAQRDKVYLVGVGLRAA
jgi:hypothetical protein